MFEISLFLAQAFLIAVTVFVLIRYSDEVPFIVVMAVTYFGFYRYFALSSGWTGLVDIRNLYNLSNIRDDELSGALAVMTLGESVMVVGYMAVRRFVTPTTFFSAEERAISRTTTPLAMIIAWVLMAVSTVAQLYIGSALSSGEAIAFGYGYASHLSFMRIGAAIVLFQLYLSGGFITRRQLIVLYAFFALLVLSSFQIGQRFQFIGWILGIGMLWSYQSSGTVRLAKLAAAVASILLVVGIAGALRADPAETLDLKNSTIYRIVSAEDANMLDGLVLLMKVYPEILPYTHGGGHLEILLRPIPRALWPDKPAGGYASAVSTRDYDARERGTVGFSPSLFGSFYAEGGWIGTILLAALYGAAFAALANWACRHGLLISALVRASTAAALIPLIRGGDLAGAVAWLVFGFLPVALFVYFVKRRFKIAAAKQSPAVLTQRIASGPFRR